MTLAETETDVRERLRWDLPLFVEPPEAPDALWQGVRIVPKMGGQPVPFFLKPEQRRFYDALIKQRDAGLPMRAVILKARQIGFSTVTQALMIQRVTQYQYHHALVLAQINQTAQKLFDKGVLMWRSMADVYDLKPKKEGGRKSRLLELDNGSVYQADNAKEFEAGRGLTLQSLHCSEVASFPDAERKLTGLLEAVPDEPGTLVVYESTAKGQNYFKDLWDSAESGESGALAFFSGWFEEDSYRLRFANDHEFEDFMGDIGNGSIGEDEPELLRLLTEDRGFDQRDAAERLNWRRRKIRGYKGDVDRFHQEYPSTAAEAFLTTGRHVFSIPDIRKMQAKVLKVPEPETGTLEIVGPMKSHLSRGVTVHVPQAVEFVPSPINDDRRPGWRIWTQPQPKTDDTPQGQYIIGGDASGGDEIEGASAYHVLSVLDHRTREQVAEYRSRIDPDELALEAYKACLYFNMPWVAIEVTGSWGGPAMRRLARDFKYPFVYKRQRSDSHQVKEEDRLGWHTGFAEKKLLITELKEMLREEDPGIRSRGLADEFGWYIMDDRNRQKPEFGKTSDRLIARGIAVCVAREKPLRPDRKPGHTRSTIEGLTLSRAGYR